MVSSGSNSPDGLPVIAKMMSSVGHRVLLARLRAERREVVFTVAAGIGADVFAFVTDLNFVVGAQGAFPGFLGMNGGLIQLIVRPFDVNAVIASCTESCDVT